MAGRVVLIKSVLQSIPTYIVQTFIILKSVITKLERIMKNFFWRYGMDKKNHLHLKSWKDICQPREFGGLGIRSIGDMNTARVMKMNWQMQSTPSKLWVQLIRACYLRGKCRLGWQQTQQNSSWIWGGIKKCEELLDNGICYQIGRHSTARIREDAWIPSIKNFKIPEEV